jgi:heme/copper-type cytochrome/quinol oxidase subunit 3
MKKKIPKKKIFFILFVFIVNDLFAFGHLFIIFLVLNLVKTKKKEKKKRSRELNLNKYIDIFG